MIASDRLAVVNLEPFAAGDLERARVETKLVQNRRVDVGDVVPVFNGMEADLVGRSVNNATLDAAAGEPGTESLGMMVAAVSLGHPANGQTRSPRPRWFHRAARAA